MTSDEIRRQWYENVRSAAAGKLLVRPKLEQFPATKLGRPSRMSAALPQIV